MRNLVRRRIIWIEHWQKAVKENVQNQQSVNFYSLQTDAVAPSPILGRWLVLRAVERSKDRNDWCWQPCAMWYVRICAARSFKLVHRWVVFVPTASAWLAVFGGICPAPLPTASTWLAIGMLKERWRAGSWNKMACHRHPRTEIQGAQSKQIIYSKAPQPLRFFSSI